MLLLNFVEINLVSSESRGWPTFLSKLETRKGSKKQEHGSSDVTLESGCQILLDTRYITLTSDTRETIGAYLIREKLLHTTKI